jgi:Uma2 family endonuclease
MAWDIAVVSPIEPAGVAAQGPGAGCRATMPSQAVRTFACENEPMATPAVRQSSTDPDLPLYRLDGETYERLVAGGALGGIDVELCDGLLVNRCPDGGDALHRFDTDTYNRMVDTGALDDLPLELLEGLLIEMSPQGASHASVIWRLTRHLSGARAWLGVQLPLELRPGSEPEPDLALVERKPSSRLHPSHALLAVEVAVTSHGKDRDKKSVIYARAGIGTYWLVDVPGQAVEVRSDPGPRGYGRCQVYKPGDRIPSPADGVPDLEVAALFDGLET